MGNVVQKFNIIRGPLIYRIHNSLPTSELGRDYVKTALEEHSQKFLNVFSVTKSVLYYTWPVWSVFLYRRGYFTVAYGTTFLRYSLWLTCIYVGLMVVRGIGRMKNQEYLDFVTVMRPGGDGDRKRRYDFDFSHWPVDYVYNENSEVKKQNITPPPYHLTGRLKSVMEGSSIASFIVRGLPCELLSYLISHLFGLSMVYPGSTALLNTVISIGLQDGRNKLVENHEGRRAKLKTIDGNFIDTMFVNKAIEGHDSRGSTLVICCEGNAGFYEVGIMTTVLEASYSVLGWNHPGFGHSTGSPFPAAEINAMDTVMQYAIERLGFPPEHIILFGWSIGAYSALQGARMYPEVKAVFLDATFDDVVPLAAKAMPPSLENIVKRTMRGYINLHNSELIKEYSGPVHLVRRKMDEVMNKDHPHAVASNCGNPLLYKMLLHRFPLLFGTKDEDVALVKVALDSWLAREDDVLRASVVEHYQMIERFCESALRAYIDNNSADYPIMMGEGLSVEARQRMVLYLATKHMSHYDSTHCTPLPPVMFTEPWDVRKDLPPASPGQNSLDDSSDDFEIVNRDNNPYQTLDHEALH